MDGTLKYVSPSNEIIERVNSTSCPPEKVHTVANPDGALPNRKKVLKSSLAAHTTSPPPAPLRYHSNNLQTKKKSAAAFCYDVRCC